MVLRRCIPSVIVLSIPEQIYDIQIYILTFINCWLKNVSDRVSAFRYIT